MHVNESAERQDRPWLGGDGSLTEPHLEVGWAVGLPTGGTSPPRLGAASASSMARAANHAADEGPRCACEEGPPERPFGSGRRRTGTNSGDHGGGDGHAEGRACLSRRAVQGAGLPGASRWHRVEAPGLDWQEREGLPDPQGDHQRDRDDRGVCLVVTSASRTSTMVTASSSAGVATCSTNARDHGFRR